LRRGGAAATEPSATESLAEKWHGIALLDALLERGRLVKNDLTLIPLMLEKGVQVNAHALSVGFSAAKKHVSPSASSASGLGDGRKHIVYR
jgi:hypothetical protein